MNERIYLSSPDVGANEEAAVVRAMRSGWIAPLGPEVDRFELELAERTGRGFAVALSSGTAAIHIGLLNLGVNPTDVVITSTMTFAATANAIVYTGAEPIFVDCDWTGNVNPQLVDAAVSSELDKGRRIGAILPVDLFGKIANYESIIPIGQKHGIPVLSDAAESLGAVRNGQPAASFGHAAAISFNGNKVMTTSGGGALVSDDKELIDRARYLATQARQPMVHYEHTEIGYNYRLSNILAGLGRAQLDRLDAMIHRRRSWRQRYSLLFGSVQGVEIFGGDSGNTCQSPTHDNYWLTTITVDADKTGWSADDLRKHLELANVESRPVWKPMHLQPVFSKSTSYLDGTSDLLFDSGLSLPSGSSITDVQFARVTDSIQMFLNGKR